MVVVIMSGDVVVVVVIVGGGVVVEGSGWDGRWCSCWTILGSTLLRRFLLGANSLCLEHRFSAPRTLIYCAPMNNFQLLEVVDRVSETQLQVGENSD